MLLNKKQFFNKYAFYLIIFLVTVIIFTPVINGQYMKGHDTFYHLANIEAIISNLSNNLFPDKVVPIIVNDLGWGNGIFYPSLPHYFTAYLGKCLSLFDISALTAMKLTHFITVFLSGIFMFWLGKKITNNNKAALISSILYITFPYYIIDIWVRDAYAETFIFMAIPLIFLGLQYLFENNNKKFYLFFIIGYVLAMASHLVLSIYLTIFVLVFLLINYKKVFTKNNLKCLVLSALIILALTTPTTFPLIEHTLYGNYAVYLDGFMFDGNTIKDGALTLADYFNQERPVGVVIFTISYIALLCFILVLFNIKKINNKDLNKYIIMTLFTFLFLSPIFPWQLMPDFLLNIQFIWRLETFLALFISICAGSVIFLISKKNLKNIVIIVIFIAVTSVFSFTKMSYISYIDTKGVDYSSYGAASYQYLPVKALDNKDYLLNRDNKIKVKNGEAKIKIIENETPRLIFNIKTNDKVTLELPRIYYLGYEITLKNKDKTKNISYKENKNGLMEIALKDSGTVTVNYTGTLFYKISLIIFIVALLISIIYLIITSRGVKPSRN